jgi:hypothetical protein
MFQNQVGKQLLVALLLSLGSAHVPRHFREDQLQFHLYRPFLAFRITTLGHSWMTLMFILGIIQVQFDLLCHLTQQKIQRTVTAMMPRPICKLLVSNHRHLKKLNQRNKPMLTILHTTPDLHQVQLSPLHTHPKIHREEYAM